MFIPTGGSPDRASFTYNVSLVLVFSFFFRQIEVFIKRPESPTNTLQRPRKRPKKTQITNRAQGPPTTRSTRRDPAAARTHATAQTSTPFGTSPGKPTVDSPGRIGNHSIHPSPPQTPSTPVKTKLGERQSRVRDLIRRRLNPSPR